MVVMAMVALNFLFFQAIQLKHAASSKKLGYIISIVPESMLLYFAMRLSWFSSLIICSSC